VNERIEHLRDGFLNIVVADVLTSLVVTCSFRHLIIENVNLNLEMQDDKENMSVLNVFDFTAIDEMDPSLAEGHRLYYDREVPFELRIQDTNTGKHSDLGP
jgi:hypothetical protein